MRKITQSEAEKRFKKQNLQLIGFYKNSNTKVETKCFCGNIFYTFPSNVFSKQTSSCGCIASASASKRFRHNLTNKRFGKLIVLNYSHSDIYGCYWNCLCDCGKYKLCLTAHLNSKIVRSCGCLRQDINIQSKYFQSKNGVLYSKPQLEIQKMIGGKINLQTDAGFIDIALEKDKIAIEYDEWYWHKDTFEKDCKRVSKLLNLGWKVITIKARKNQITKANLLQSIEEAKLFRGKFWKIIKLEGYDVFDS